MKKILILVMICVFLAGCAGSPIFAVATPCDTPPVSTTATSVATNFSIQSPTGFYWPTDIGDPKAYNNWLAANCSWVENKNYKTINNIDYYHIGMDIIGAEGDKVFAIADGTIVGFSPPNSNSSKWATVVAGGDPSGWGNGNIAILIDHQLVTGSHFVAVYGHIKYDPNNKIHTGETTTVRGHDVLGLMGPYSSPHLHLGIFEIKPGGPKTDLGHLGMLACPKTAPIQDTNGFTNPYEWLITRTPKNQTETIPTSVPCPLPAATPQSSRMSEPVTPVRNLIEAINARDGAAALRSYSLTDGLIVNPLLNVLFQSIDQQKIRPTFSNMVYSSTSPQGGKATVSLGGKLDLYNVNSDTHYTQDVGWDVGVYQSLGNWYIDLMGVRQLLQWIEELIR